MIIFEIAVTQFFSAFLLHLGIWRLRVPKRQTRALLLLFSAWFVLTTGAIALPGLYRPLAPLSAWQVGIQTAILYLALTLAYVISYSALEAESPSLLIISKIARAAENGLPEKILYGDLNDHVLVIPRLKDLQRDGLVLFKEGSYTLTKKGLRFISIFTFYRRLLGAEMGG